MYRVGHIFHHINCIVFASAVLLSGKLLAQDTAHFPRDTSFTVYSEYQKERKNFPNIEIVRLPLIDSSRWERDVVYNSIMKAQNGTRDLHVDIFKPADQARISPAILLLHGGGWSSGNKSHLFPLAYAIANSGYVAIAVEYRLSGEAMYPAAVADVKHALQWLRTHAKELHVDTNKIALLGCSAGAQLAGLVAVTNRVKKLGGKKIPTKQVEVNAVVSIDGIVSFVHPEARAESSAASKWLGGTRETNIRNWRSASALEYVNKDTPSFGFINSSIPRFHAGRDDMIKKLNKLGIYTEVHTLPDTPHPFWLFHPWFEPTVEHTLSYLDKVFNQRNVVDK